MTRVEFFCGTHRSGREAAIDALVRAHWGKALLITPTRALADRRMEALLADGSLPGGFGAPVCEFTGFAENLLAAEGRRPRMLESLDRLLLMEGCLAEMAAQRPAGAGGPDPAAPGWPRHLLAVITDLKQAAVEPREFAERIGRLPEPGPFDALVAEAYARYQAALLASARYDVPGLYWEARAVCDAFAPAVLKGVELVALDGFDDFTPSQARLVAAIASRVPRMVIGLNYDTASGRADLFDVPRTAHERLREEFKGRGLDVLETFDVRVLQIQNWAQYAAGHLLLQDRIEPEERDAALAPLENNVRLVPCLDAQHELETVARAVKTHILDEGVAPGRIAVAFRDFASVAGQLREVFREFGIPCRVRHRPSLRQSAVGTFVLRLLEAVNGWQRAAVVDIMASPWFQPEDAPGPQDAAAALAREANHVSGREDLFNGLEWLAVRLDKRDNSGEDRPGRLPMPNPKEALAALRARAGVLAKLDETMPENAALREHAVALDRVLRTCRMEAGFDMLADKWHRCAEEDALAGLRRVIETLHDTGFSGEDLSRGAFVGMLSRAMDGETFAWPDDRNGVWCGDAAKLRHQSFDHLYYCGANEGVAPRPPSSNAVYPQADVERLGAGGIRMDGAPEHASMERLLFHHALCAADESFTITWRMQGADGREALPGAFVTELHDLLGDHTEAPRPRADSLVPPPDEVACPRDVANARFLRDCPRLAKAFSADLDGAGEALAMELRRHSEADYDAFDGVLADAETKAWVAGRFDERHQFSVSQIEKYIGCPFSFFVRHVLGIEELREPAEELEPLERGTILHDAMRRLLESHPGMSAAALLAEHGEEGVADLLDQVLRESFDAKAGRLAPVPDALLDAERARMKAQLLRFMCRMVEKLGDVYRPAHAEAAFGGARGGRGDTLQTPEPFPFEHGGVKALFSGRIDRLDLTDDGRARVVDYKTGGVPANSAIYNGKDLQLTVYQWVVSQVLLPGTVCDEAWYCSLSKNADTDATGKTRRKDKRYDDLWERREETARETIARAVTRIRAGWFPPEPDDPKHPDCPDAGRFQAARIARKQAAAGRAAYDLGEDGGEDA